MSLFDSVFADIECALCHDRREHEIQFKVSIGRTYHPSMQEVRIGQKLGAGWPAIPLVEAQGFVAFDCCPGTTESAFDDERRSCWCLIRIERGTVMSVVYPQPPEHRWVSLPRGRLWARRHAVASEWYRLNLVKHLAKLGAEPVTAMLTQRLGMAVRLSVPIDYRGLGRSLIETGEISGNYVRASPGQPWRRLRGRPYL